MVYDWIFASTRFALETKWNCGDNDLYLYVILILNDLAMLWFDSYKYVVYVDNHMLWNFDWDLCKHMIHIEKLHVCGSYLQHPFGNCKHMIHVNNYML